MDLFQSVRWFYARLYGGNFMMLYQLARLDDLRGRIENP